MLTKDYIAGLVDGEGSFTVFVRNPDIPQNIKRRVKIEPRFYLKLIARDKKILEDLKDYFQCGNVYFQKDNRKNHQDCYRYEVANRRDLVNIIIPFFRANPLQFPSQQKDFTIFCKIMESIARKDHLTLSGQRTLLALKQTMH